MSHEIGTPMNAILGMAQVLEKGPVGAQQQHQCARLILDSGRELLGLLNEILDLAKVESGQMLLHPSIVSPVGVARDALETYRELAESRGLPLSIRSTLPESRLCLLDAARFKQILGNLLSNAIKFTPTGSISIEIDELEPDASGARLEVAVRDTGIGIPGDQIDQLFEKFWQVDNALTRRHTGSGLGLSIMRQLAELMGGQASVPPLPESASAQRPIRRRHPCEPNDRRHSCV
jgi:signal transduction histidine kinase